MIGQWRYSFLADKLSAAMHIAERVYSLAQEQDDPRLMIGAYNALAATLYNRGDFESARQHAMRGVRIWRSGGGQSHQKTSIRRDRNRVVRLPALRPDDRAGLRQAFLPQIGSIFFETSSILKL